MCYSHVGEEEAARTQVVHDGPRGCRGGAVLSADPVGTAEQHHHFRTSVSATLLIWKPNDYHERPLWFIFCCLQGVWEEAERERGEGEGAA